MYMTLAKTIHVYESISTAPQNKHLYSVFTRNEAEKEEDVFILRGTSKVYMLRYKIFGK